MENTINQEQTKSKLLPVIALRGRVAFPHATLSFEVGREITLKAVQQATDTDNLVLILTQRETEKTDITAEDLYDVGCVAKIQQVSQISGGAVRVVCEGLYRAQARSVALADGFFRAVTDPISTVYNEKKDAVIEAYLRTIKVLIKEVFSGSSKTGKEIAEKLDKLDAPEDYIDVAIYYMRVRLDVKQQLLAEPNLVERLALFARCLNDELEVSKLEKKLANTVRQSIDKNQKEYFLREQLKAIHAELGDDEKESDEYRAKLLEKHLPQDLEVKCLKEVDRLGKMPPSSAEYTVITNYLDQVIALPWAEETQDTEALADCVKVLEADHFGLEKIKERITEYLAVLKLTKSMKAPILCLVGPPGVGKTSIAQSIARALNRKFVRMSLGGVKDEAEIRGHRRTYVGAMPGRILYGMKNAGSINPVFLLDEIDKISADHQGDPASALLEVLDPEQNATFRDRFLETPYDLSKVLFIATANDLGGIPTPLRDRMEIIQLSGYTMEEKTEIARRYLIPKQLKANGLTKQNANFTEKGLHALIDGYTREAGVRGLERTVGSVCRKIAVQYASNPDLPKVRVDKNKVIELLGAMPYKRDNDRFVAEVGVVNGLAWTAVGGETLTVETTAMSGKGEVKLTGHLGDVMKESALAALSYIRAHADSFGIDKDKLAETDLHVHVPEGATPKDGPSAGITIATAILSVLTGRAVRGDVAMTGEITLRGRVLPIGGLKEKALAARRLGIKTVVIPYDNASEIADLPKVLQDDITFVPVKRVDEVFDLVLEGGSHFSKAAKTPKKKSAKTLPATPSLKDEQASVRCQK